MNIRAMKIGMKVCISHNLLKTKRQYGISGPMEKMKGNIYPIQKIETASRKVPLVRVCGFAWHPDDLLSSDDSITEEKQEHIFHFDKENLDT